MLSRAKEVDEGDIAASLPASQSSPRVPEGDPGLTLGLGESKDWRKKEPKGEVRRTKWELSRASAPVSTFSPTTTRDDAPSSFSQKL